MPLDLDFDADGVAWLTAAGDFSWEDAITAVRRVYADPRFAARARTVWDLRAGRALLDGEEVRLLAEHVREERPEGRGRTAIVAGDDLTFGMGRMYEQIAADGPVDVNVFRDLEPATRWLASEG